MQFSIVLTLCASLLAVNASKLCADFVVKSTEFITGSSGRQLNFTRVSCPGVTTLTPKTVPSVEVRDLVKRSASECTISPCFCGDSCGDTECVASPGSINPLDCSNLLFEFILSTETFIIPAGDGAILTDDTCAFEVINLLATEAQYCLSDFVTTASDVSSDCPSEEGVCAGPGGDFVVELLFN